MVVLLVGALCLTGCSSGSDDDDAADSTTTTTDGSAGDVSSGFADRSDDYLAVAAKVELGDDASRDKVWRLSLIHI